MPKPTSPAPAAKQALYDKLIATHPDVERKGAANPYTSRNGHMFSFLQKDRTLALRLPKAEREAFLKEHNTRLAVSYNTVMKEYVDVPDALFAKTATLKKLFHLSYDYIGTLKPNPTTRKKTKKKAAKKTTTKKAATKNPAKKRAKKKATKKTASKKNAKKTTKERTPKER